MGILKNKSFWLMLFILALGFALRLIFIDKPDGLWNDEYISWAIAAIPFGKKFISAVIAQCHMPFYYLYLKFFIHFFGNSDLMLRLTSVLIGMLSICSMYFVGKEFSKDKKDDRLANLCASITAISSFSIYFSQEVRLYELLFFFSSLSLIFTLRLGKDQNIRNLVFYILSNFLIIFTHTIGFVFVIFNLAFTSFWLLKTNNEYKKTIKITWSVFALLLLISSPLMYKVFTSHPYSQWWGHFTLSKVAFMITDYFSPILTNIVNAPDNFFYHFNLRFFIYAILPSIIAISGIVKALKSKKYEVLGLFYVCLAFVLFLVTLAIAGKLMFITKYSMEIYPILISLFGLGLLEFKKGLRTFLIFTFCFLNLYYVLYSPLSAPRMHRSEGHKIVADLLKNAKLNNEDFILLNYYPKDRFEKYFDFNCYKVISINKGNFFDYLGLKSEKDFSQINNKSFDTKLDDEVIKKLKPNQKLAVVILNDVAMYSPVQIEAIRNDEKLYKKAPFLFVVFSYFKNETLKEGLAKLKILRIEQKGSWTVVTFTK